MLHYPWLQHSQRVGLNVHGISYLQSVGHSAWHDSTLMPAQNGHRQRCLLLWDEPAVGSDGSSAGPSHAYHCHRGTVFQTWSGSRTALWVAHKQQDKLMSVEYSYYLY